MTSRGITRAGGWSPIITGAGRGLLELITLMAGLLIWVRGSVLGALLGLNSVGDTAQHVTQQQ
jgi:hypothetical protein